MKVCYLSNIESYMQSWLDFFIKRGWEVYNISRNSTQLDINPRVKIYRLPINAYIGFPLHLYLINKIIKKNKPDIIHAQNMQAYGIYALAINNVPFIIHEGGPSHMETSKNIQRLLERYAYKKADLITTEVEETRLILSDEYRIQKEKIKALLWGVDLSLFNRNYENEVEKLKKKLNIKPKDFIIIYNRTLNKYNGIKQSLYVLKELKSSFIKLILFKYGMTRAYYIKIKELIEKLNLTKNVIFLDPVPRKEMPIYLNLADVAINLLEVDNGSSAIAEQMACGCIVIGTDNGGYRGRIINGENGFLIDDRNSIEKIANIIKYSIETPEIKDKFYKYNKQYIKKHENWNIQMKKMEKLYLDLIEKHKKLNS